MRRRQLPESSDESARHHPMARASTGRAPMSEEEHAALEAKETALRNMDAQIDAAYAILEDYSDMLTGLIFTDRRCWLVAAGVAVLAFIAMVLAVRSAAISLVTALFVAFVAFGASVLVSQSAANMQRTRYYVSCDYVTAQAARLVSLLGPSEDGGGDDNVDIKVSDGGSAACAELRLFLRMFHAYLHLGYCRSILAPAVIQADVTSGFALFAKLRDLYPASLDARAAAHLDKLKQNHLVFLVQRPDIVNKLRVLISRSRGVGSLVLCDYGCTRLYPIALQCWKLYKEPRDASHVAELDRLCETSNNTAFSSHDERLFELTMHGFASSHGNNAV